MCAVVRVIDSGAFQPKWSHSVVQKFNITTNVLRAQNVSKPNFFEYNFSANTFFKNPGLIALTDSSVGVGILMCVGSLELQHTLTHT